MKTVIFIQVLYMLINLEANNSIVNGAEKCESSIETRAVLLSCPEKDTGCEDDDPLTKATQADEYRLLQVKPSEMKRIKAEIEREFPTRVTDCKRKLVITMKLNNKGKIECDDGFIVIDHVYDPLTRGKARLLSPVIVKLRQEQMVQLYPLQFQKVVNSNPNENIFTKDTCSNYEGCSTDLDNPSCGITTYDGKPIPFSEGFCCSCDSYVNAMREMLPNKHENANRYKDPALFGTQKNRITRSREPSRVIINPNLEKIRAGNRQSVRHVSFNDESDNCDVNSVEEQVRTPPNFFFEQDRQIVCAPEALLKELCNFDGKDGKEDETNDDDQNNSNDYQNKEVPVENRGNENSNSNDKYECNESKCNKPDSNTNNNNNNDSNDFRKDNDSASNNDKNKQITCRTTSPNNKKTFRDGKIMINQHTQYDIRDYLNGVDLESGSQYRYTDKNKFLERPIKTDEGKTNVIEIMKRKREAGNSLTNPQHRKKRLTWDKEEYNLSFQHPIDQKGRRYKSIMNAADRKMLNLKVNDNCNTDQEDCGNEAQASTSKMNCTLPVFFFTHDKSILCPPGCPPCDGKAGRDVGGEDNKTEGSHGKFGESSEYDNTKTHIDRENDNVEEDEQPPAPSPQSPKITRLHKNNDGTWDVNAAAKHGNLLWLDLIKNGDDSRQNPEKIEELNFEQKRVIPNTDRFKIRDEVIHNGLKVSPEDRLDYGIESGNYREKQKAKNNPPYPLDALLPIDISSAKYDAKKSDSYKLRGNLYGSGNTNPKIRKELEIIIPDKQNILHKVNVDLRAEDFDSILKGLYAEKNEKNNLQGVKTLNELDKETSKDIETSGMEGQSEQRYNLCQGRVTLNGKEDASKSDNEKYYGENKWKSYYSPNKYQATWSEKMNPYWRHYKNDMNGRDSLVDLLTDNYPRRDYMDNQYQVSSKNVFFADTKRHRNIKKERRVKKYDYDDSGEDTEESSRSEHGKYSNNREYVRSKNFKEPDIQNTKFGDSSYKDDYFEGFQRESNMDSYLRRNRRAGPTHNAQKFISDSDKYNDRHKRKYINYVRNRSKRSLGESQKPNFVKISEWEHRTPPGPEYQFDVSTFTKVKHPYRHSSGGGDEQCLGDVQKNFANFIPRSTEENREWNIAQREFRMHLDRERLMQSYLTAPNKFKRDIQNDMKGKRHVMTGRRQERGGQDCSDGSTPKVSTCKTSTSTTSTTVTEKDADSLDSAHESTHCMKLSDLWYSVYLIKRPELAQLIGVQIYDKQTMCDGTTNWREVTKGYMVRLGSFLQRAEDDVPTISMTYTPTGPDMSKDEPKLDTENYRLLIPSHLTNEKKSRLYPEFYGGPSEFMLVNKDEMTDTGAECNKVGTSFEAFARQPGRCTKPPGSCLKRQPVDLWREDMTARIRGKRGKYFIENFGNVSNTSIKSYANITGDYLAMDYYGEYSSILEIEMRADGNAVVRQGENAQIPLVYIDSINPKKTKIVLSVMNMGLTSSLFRPRLGECPSNLDPTWCPLEGPLVQIPPQQRHDFKLELTGKLPAKKIHCAVEVLNHYNKKVAHRKIVIRRADRCFCAFYCKCVCVATNKHTSCAQLSREEYNAAGYFDPIPQRNVQGGSKRATFWKNLKIVLISMAYMLLLLGIIKAVLGLFWRRLGSSGVQVIVGPRTLSRYYESNLSCFQVVYDECGFPINPQTCKTVQIVPRWIEMFINLLFFYLYMLRVIVLLISSVPCFKSLCGDCENCCRIEDSDDDVTRYRTSQIKPSTNNFSYNVMTFLSKKNKAERNPLYNPYKADDDPLEEDDTEFVLEEIIRYKSKNSDLNDEFRKNKCEDLN